MPKIVRFHETGSADVPRLEGRDQAPGGCNRVKPGRGDLSRNRNIRSYVLFSTTRNPERLARTKDWIYARLERGELNPKIAKTFPVNEVVQAHEYMESNEQIGKIVLVG
jgi:NADPH:quinone reductase-like Zn-dependent oxidoreductase